MTGAVALVLVGMQRALWGTGGAPGIPVAERARVLPGIGAELLRARENAVMVVHSPELQLVHGLSDSPAQKALRRELGEDQPSAVEGSIAAEFVEEFSPGEGEYVVARRRDSAITDTRLNTLLRSHAIASVRLVGGETDRAILATAVALRGADYVPIVVEDAVASRHHERHEAAITVLRGLVLTESAAS